MLGVWIDSTLSEHFSALTRRDAQLSCRVCGSSIPISIITLCSGVVVVVVVVGYVGRRSGRRRDQVSRQTAFRCHYDM